MYSGRLDIKVDSCLYNNTSIIIALVRKDYSLSYMKTFLEWYGYYYSLEEIAEFIETDFFKTRMQDFLEENNLPGKEYKVKTNDGFQPHPLYT